MFDGGGRVFYQNGQTLINQLIMRDPDRPVVVSY